MTARSAARIQSSFRPGSCPYDVNSAPKVSSVLRLLEQRKATAAHLFSNGNLFRTQVQSSVVAADDSALPHCRMASKAIARKTSVKRARTQATGHYKGTREDRAAELH